MIAGRFINSSLKNTALTKKKLSLAKVHDACKDSLFYANPFTSNDKFLALRRWSKDDE